jgi:hypothetical protein
VFSSGKPPQSRMAKLLLLVSMLFKAQRITAQEKSALKDLIIQDHEALVCALEAFETEKDFDELEDTLHRICQSTYHRSRVGLLCAVSDWRCLRSTAQ